MREKLFIIRFDDVDIEVQINACTFEVAVHKAEKMLQGQFLGNKVSGRAVA